jgi:hypothetical protein
MDRAFAHDSEAEVAEWLDREGIRWQYEPHTFVLELDAEGTVIQAVTPDFYLPEVDIYLEVTTMRQSLTTRKNRKLRHLNERHGVVATIIYARDLVRLRNTWRDD